MVHNANNESDQEITRVYRYGAIGDDHPRVDYRITNRRKFCQLVRLPMNRESRMPRRPDEIERNQRGGSLWLE